MAYSSLSTSTPFQFEIRFYNSWWERNSCKIFYKGREGHNKVYDVKDSQYRALKIVFSLAKNFEDMVCSLTDSEIQFMDSRLFGQLTSIFGNFYQEYPDNFVDSTSYIERLPHEHLRDFKIGDEIINGYPKSIRLERTTLHIVFFLSYWDGPTHEVQVEVPQTFTNMVKIGLAANFLRNIQSDCLSFYQFYMAGNWSRMLSDIYGHPCNVPQRIKDYLPGDCSYYKFWRPKSNEL